MAETLSDTSRGGTLSGSANTGYPPGQLSGSANTGQPAPQNGTPVATSERQNLRNGGAGNSMPVGGDQTNSIPVGK